MTPEEFEQALINHAHATANYAASLSESTYADMRQSESICMAQYVRLYEALCHIAKAEGRFSTDPLTHAENTIEDMRQLAKDALP